jgi:hypothetical protein
LIIAVGLAIMISAWPAAFGLLLLNMFKPAPIFEGYKALV